LYKTHALERLMSQGWWDYLIFHDFNGSMFHIETNFKGILLNRLRKSKNSLPRKKRKKKMI
jgi:hypothetical protein